MTLARHGPDGSLWIGGVWCHSCQRDTYSHAETGECHRCHRVPDSPYRPRGIVVREFGRDHAGPREPGSTGPGSSPA